jgi:hypothetical protein
MQNGQVDIVQNARDAQARERCIGFHGQEFASEAIDNAKDRDGTTRCRMHHTHSPKIISVRQNGLRDADTQQLLATSALYGSARFPIHAK